MTEGQRDSPRLRTNRDLYRFVADLTQRHGETRHPLELYLRALWGLSAPRSDHPFLSLDEFASFLAAAFEVEPAPFDPAWRRREFRSKGRGDYELWSETILNQIVDLREMDESGILRNQLRYFGVDAPRGVRWFNSDPLTYLECAVEGAFGGWQPGDETGRTFVPGEAVVLDADGNVKGADPRDLARPEFGMPQVTWQDFTKFLRMGQYYE